MIIWLEITLGESMSLRSPYRPSPDPSRKREGRKAGLA